MNPIEDDQVSEPDSASATGPNDRKRAKLPLFPLSSPLFPGMPLPLHIFEPRYRLLLRDQARSDPVFGVVLTRSGREVADKPEIHTVGTSASLLGMHQHDDGRSDIVVRGVQRFRVLETDWSGSYLVAQVEWLTESDAESHTWDSDALADRTRTAMLRLVAAAATAGNIAVPTLSLPDDPADLGYLLSRTLWLNTWERQQLLEIPGPGERLARLLTIIRREYQMLTRTGAAGTPIERPGSRFLPN